MSVVEILLLRSLLLFLTIGGAAGMIVGAMLIWRPDRMQAVNKFFSRWVSTRHMDRELERSIVLEPWIYRNHRLVGVMILLAVCYILYVFLVGLNQDDAAKSLALQFQLPLMLVDALLDALAMSAVLSAVFSACIGVFLLLRPSMLRNFERRANQWISMRRALKPAEISRASLDEFVLQHARQLGVFLMLGGLYAIVLLSYGLGQYA